MIYSTLFGKVIINEFKKELVDMDLYDELEMDYFAELQEAASNSYLYEEDYDRNSMGLPSLDDFDEVYIDEHILEDRNANKIITTLNEIKDFYYIFEKFFGIYDEWSSTLISCEEDLKENKKESIINSFNHFLTNNNQKYYTYCIEDIYEWINKKLNNFELNIDQININDYLSVEDSVEFIDQYNNEYCLSFDNIELAPQSWETHHIYIELSKNGNKIANGEITIDYGGAEFDDEVNAAEGLETNIDIDLEDIHTELLKIKNSFEEYIKVEREIIEKLENVFHF